MPPQTSSVEWRFILILCNVTTYSNKMRRIEFSLMTHSDPLKRSRWAPLRACQESGFREGDKQAKKKRQHVHIMWKHNTWHGTPSAETLYFRYFEIFRRVKDLLRRGLLDQKQKGQTKSKFNQRGGGGGASLTNLL